MPESVIINTKYFLEFVATPGPTERDSPLTTVVGISIGVGIIVLGAGSMFGVWIAKRNKKTTADDTGSELVSPEKQKTRNRRISFTDVVNGNVEQPTVQEFNNLVSFEDDDLGQRLTRFQGERFNKIGQLNLVKTVLPFDQNRVKLKNPIDGYDYINASLISQPASEDQTYDELIYSDILSCKKVKMIVGQDPVPHTLPHHWALIYENEVDFVVNFTTKSLKLGKVYRFGSISVRVLNHRKMSDTLSRTEISLFNMSAPGAKHEHRSSIFKIIGWPDDETIAADQVKGIVTALVLMRKEMRVDMDSAKMMVHDRHGGVGPGAVIVALFQLFEKVDDSLTNENKIKSTTETLNVFETVNKLRMERASMVDNFEAYKLIYRCVEHYGYDRQAFLKLKPDETQAKSLADPKPKSATPIKMPIKNTSTRNGQIEISEEYVLHHDYANEPNGMFDDVYDEYVIEDE